MNNFLKENTISITGLRRHKLNWDRKVYKENESKMICFLVEYLENYINEGFENFLCGMASGSDFIFAKAVIILKDKYKHILLHAIVPFVDQDKYYSHEDKLEYNNLIKKCDSIRILNFEYSKNCYEIRNEFLIESSSVLLAITYDVNMHRSGTTQTINMAKRSNLKIVQLNPENFEITNII